MMTLIELHDAVDSMLEARGVQFFQASELMPRHALPNPDSDSFSMTLALMVTNILPTVHYADLLRETFGPTRVTSGYRCHKYNKSVGGAPNSLHTEFNALDLQPASGDPDLWARYLHTIGQTRAGGLGVYHDSNFVHIDTRFLMFGRPATTWEER